MQGKDFSHPLEMTMPVISNPSAALRINSVRDLSHSFFKGVFEHYEGLTIQC